MGYLIKINYFCNDFFDNFWYYIGKEVRMFQERSKVLFVCNILATLYAIYLIVYFAGVNTDVKDDAEALGGAIATALVTPHIIMITLGAIFGWIGFALKKSWGALVSAILYCVAFVLFFVYFMFTIPLIVLGFVGYTKQKQLTEKKA